MPDKLTPERRSANMSRIRSRDMKPEVAVRSTLHRAGYRFRTHVKDLPGKPDIVFPRRRKIIFVHGCFWHLHPDPNCKDARIPKSNKAYWDTKLAKNVERDRDQFAALEAAGWSVMTIWECEIRDITDALARLTEFLGPPR